MQLFNHALIWMHGWKDCWHGVAFTLCDKSIGTNWFRDSITVFVSCTFQCWFCLWIFCNISTTGYILTTHLPMQSSQLRLTSHLFAYSTIQRTSAWHITWVLWSFTEIEVSSFRRNVNHFPTGRCHFDISTSLFHCLMYRCILLAVKGTAHLKQHSY